MTSSEQKPEAPSWTPAMRIAWATLIERRGKVGGLWLWIVGPYAASGLMMGIGALGNGDKDAMAWVFIGALLFMIFLVLGPFWIGTLVKEWRKGAKSLEADRKAFWQRHGVDPFAVTAPPEDKAPWE